MKQEIKYEDALLKLEALVTKIEDPQRDFNGLSEDVKAAMDLIRKCKACLRNEEDNINQLLEEE